MEAVREDIRSSVLCWLATVNADGQPNVTPKEIFCAHGDDAIVIAEIASPVSARNISATPRVCVSFVDVFRQRGFKLQGHAQMILSDDPRFMSSGGKTLVDMAGKDFEVRGLFYVTVDRVERIWAPSYRRVPAPTVEEQLAAGYRTYGVRPMSQD